MVAALTGANVLPGTRPPPRPGSTVRLDGGGELSSSMPADGPVQIAIQPWELALADPQSSALTDRVVSVHRDRGALLIRLERFTIRTRAEDDPRHPITEGSTVGLLVAPADVRVLSETDDGDAAPVRRGPLYVPSSTPMSTSEALITAVTRLPSASRRSSTASTVIEDTSRCPATSSSTFAIASPRRIATTTAGS